MIHARRLHILIAFVLLGSLWGCLKQIDLPAPPSEADNIAITATLRQGDPSVLDVNVVEVDNFSGFSAPIPVNNATVLLRDDLGNEDLVPLRFEGRYRRTFGESQDKVSIATTRSYQLVVSTAEGQMYTSTFEPLREVPKASGLSYEVETREAISESGSIVDQNFIRFFINTPLKTDGNNQKAILKWDVEGVYRFLESVPENVQIPNPKTCYVFQDLQLERPLVFNGNESGKDVLEKQFVIEEQIDHRFTKGYYLVVRQQSISQGAFEYWESIRKVVDRSGNFFDEPPGKIRGNFSNPDDPSEDVFGYFSAVQEDTVRVYIGPSDIELTVFPLCPPVIPQGQDPPRAICFDCLLITNSTTQKPDFWTP